MLCKAIPTLVHKAQSVRTTAVTAVHVAAEVCEQVQFVAADTVSFECYQ
jgi:hypothetical protein